MLNIGIIGLLLIILVLIVVFIICNVIELVKDNNYDFINTKYGGANNIYDNIPIIAANIRAYPIRGNIVGKLCDYMVNSGLRQHLENVFEAYKEYIYDYSIIEDLIDIINPMPPNDKISRFINETNLDITGGNLDAIIALKYNMCINNTHPFNFDPLYTNNKLYDKNNI